MDTVATSTSSQKQLRLQAHLALLAANIFWGAMSPISKSLMLGSSISPLALAALRIGGGALLFLLASFLLPPSFAPREKILRADWPAVFLASILMISANQGLFIVGISFTNPIDSAVMSSLTPILTMLLAAAVLHFPITRFKALGVLLGLAGVILLVTSGSANRAAAPNPLLGDSLCFGAQLCAAVYYVMFRDIIARYHPFTLMKWMFLLGALTFIPFCIPQLTQVDFADLTTANWWSIIYIILFATCISYLTLPFAQRYLKPTVVSIYNYFQPLVAAIIALWLGVGSFGPVKIAATAVIFLGVYFVNNHSDNPRPKSN